LLSLTNIDHYANASQIDTYVAERDVVLTYVLKILDDARLLDKLAFKGGTCLKKVYYGKTTRFSEKLLDWMDGVGIEYLSKKYFKGEISLCLTEVQGGLSSYSAWFLYATTLVALYLRPKLKNRTLLANMSKYTWFGTKNWLAIEIMSKDVLKQLQRDDVLNVIRELGPTLIKKL